MSASDSSRPIRHGESDALAARLLEVVGEESVTAFGRRSGVPESNLRSYINDGRMPPLDSATRIADAGGVLVDWLSTGREPKTRAELKALQDAAERASIPLDTVLLQGVIDFFSRWLEEHRETVRIDRDRHARVIAVLYKIAAASGKADPHELSQVMQLAA